MSFEIRPGDAEIFRAQRGITRQQFGLLGSKPAGFLEPPHGNPCSRNDRRPGIPIPLETGEWYAASMKTMHVDLPDQLAREVEAQVRNGRFQDSGEVVRAALREFLAGQRFELLEQHQLQDIAWALREGPALR
jgi:Arc/MetJ-type ribon-helix-helix transcriptional regulator